MTGLERRLPERRRPRSAALRLPRPAAAEQARWPAPLMPHWPKALPAFASAAHAAAPAGRRPHSAAPAAAAPAAAPAAAAARPQDGVPSRRPVSVPLPQKPHRPAAPPAAAAAAPAPLRRTAAPPPRLRPPLAQGLPALLAPGCSRLARGHARPRRCSPRQRCHPTMSAAFSRPPRPRHWKEQPVQRCRKQRADVGEARPLRCSPQAVVVRIGHQLLHGRRALASHRTILTKAEISENANQDRSSRLLVSAREVDVSARISSVDRRMACCANAEVDPDAM